MKLKEFIENLNKLIEENPANAELQVIYARDDEGNGYEAVYYGPSIGIHEGQDFISDEQIEEYDRTAEEINSVCIN